MEMHTLNNGEVIGIEMTIEMNWMMMMMMMPIHTMIE